MTDTNDKLKMPPGFRWGPDESADPPSIGDLETEKGDMVRHGCAGDTAIAYANALVRPAVEAATAELRARAEKAEETTAELRARAEKAEARIAAALGECAALEDGEGADYAGEDRAFRQAAIRIRRALGDTETLADRGEGE